MSKQTYNSKAKVVTSSSLALALAMAMVGCATTKPSPLMQEATTVVSAAESDPAVPQYASIDLQRAQQQLEAARKATQKGEPLSVRDHYAYLAKQSGLTATARAKLKTNEAVLAKGETERTRIQLQSRERDVGEARALASAERNRANMSEAEAARLDAEAKALKERSDALATELAELKAKPTDRGLVLTLGDVLFDTGKSVLKPGAQSTVARLATFLQAHPERKLQIEGFTDSVGSDSYNLELSSRRADAVKAALISQGVDPGRITTKGYGEAYPVASNDDNGGRQLNRRVEVVIGNTDAAVPERTASR